MTDIVIKLHLVPEQVLRQALHFIESDPAYEGTPAPWLAELRRGIESELIRREKNDPGPIVLRLGFLEGNEALPAVASAQAWRFLWQAAQEPEGVRLADAIIAALDRQFNATLQALAAPTN